MRVLLAGDCGCIGAVLVRFLRAAGRRVVPSVNGAGPDVRNYRVDFAKLNKTFSDFEFSSTVQDGVDECVRAYTEYGMTHDDFTSSWFVLLRRVRELLSAGLLDEMLRPQTTSQLPSPGTMPGKRAANG